MNQRRFVFSPSPPHFPILKFLSEKTPAALAALVLALAPAIRAAANDTAEEPLQTIRAQSKVLLQAGATNLTLTETIVVTPVGLKKANERPGATNLVNLLISPLWLKDENYQGSAFTALKPYLNVSHGRVRRFALMRPDGEPVRSIDQMTQDCRYVLSLELGHVLPERLTVTITMAQPTGVRPGTELIYTPSNDGQAFRPGPPDTVYTQLRIRADPSLEPWQIARGDKVLPRADSTAVNLERDVSHTIHFGVKAK